MNRDKLVDLTTTAFSESGPLANLIPGYRFSEPQLNYAIAVAKSLTHPTPGAIAMLEAETGVGKSLGYLIPLLTHTAMTDTRGVVSTFTLGLQRQILQDEIPLAIKAVKQLTGVTVTAAPRKGMRNFISRTRVEELIDAVAAEGNAGKEDFAKLTSLADHAGDIQEWLAVNGKLPLNLAQRDICLTSTSPVEERATFDQHVADSYEADIIVVTHAMLMLNALRWGKVLYKEEMELPKFHAAIVDEADQVPSAAESLLDSRISVPMVERLASHLSDQGVKPKEILSAVANWRDWMDGVYLQYQRNPLFRAEGSGGYVLLNDPRLGDLRKQSSEAAMSVVHAVNAAIEAAKSKKAKPDLIQDLIDVRNDLNGFVDLCDQETTERQSPVLRWSPVRSFPSFSAVALYPGRLASRLWRSYGDRDPYLHATVFTSATLDAPGSTGNQFRNFRDEVGCIPNYPVEDEFLDDISATFAPKKFGKMSFVLPDISVPHPNRNAEDIENDELYQPNPDWVAYCQQMINAAIAEGGRVLTLTTSYSNTEAICKDLYAGTPILRHEPGRHLSEYTEDFKAHKNVVWVTPGAWEGLNLPGMIDHLIITKIPVPPPDSPKLVAMKRLLMNKGLSEKEAEGKLYTMAYQAARRKLRQGLGRGIRSHKDKVKVWICDPRFPVESVYKDGARMAARQSLPERSCNVVNKVTACVPDRFQNALRVADYLPKAED